jgi:hypothetical protein
LEELILWTTVQAKRYFYGEVSFAGMEIQNSRLRQRRMKKYYFPNLNLDFLLLSTVLHRDHAR